VADCCLEHIAKLARVMLVCTDAFPYATCPRRALTLEGIRALQLSPDDIDEILGFPRGWTDDGSPNSLQSRLRALQSCVDGLDFDTLRRLARQRVRSTPEADNLSNQIAASLVLQLEQRRIAGIADPSKSSHPGRGDRAG
jgi:hypothetical protein